MMKKLVIIFLAMFFIPGSNHAQKIQQSQVPSVILNSFKKSFPKAVDVDWEIKNGHYKVDFETGLSRTDHEIWYNQNGKQVKHEEEIANNRLPKNVSGKISSDFRGFRVKDVKKISESGTVTYKAEVEKATEEWKVVYDSDGKMLSKIPD